MAKNQNPLLGKVGKGLNTIITVLPELQHRTKLDKNLKPLFSQPIYSSTNSNTGRIADADGEWGNGVGGLGGGGCTPHLRHLAQWGVQCSIALSALLGVKPLLEAFGPVGVNPPKGSGRAVRGI